jgi:TRAP-type uncharacterized transport system substrate-binding protein
LRTLACRAGLLTSGHERRLGVVHPGIGSGRRCEPIHALSYDGVLVASTKTPDEVVYRMVKAMHANKKAMAEVFGAMNLFDPGRMATQLEPIQYHPGAIKFYQEQGAWPPKS